MMSALRINIYGFVHFYTDYYLHGYFFGPYVPVHIRNVSCNGTESRLLECPHDDASVDDNYSDAAEMECYYGTPIHLSHFYKPHHKYCIKGGGICRDMTVILSVLFFIRCCIWIFQV